MALVNLPEDFKTEIRSLDIDSEDFFRSLQLSPLTSIRRHRHKSHADNYKQLEEVPWCPLAYYLEERPSFNVEPSFLAGEYYVQEASSMFLHYVLQQIPLFTFAEQPLVLDACAAPGGKSTILLDYLDGRGTLIANEVIRSRVKVLSENIMKWGYSNCIVTNSDLSKFSTDVQFDLIVIDAPCSGEGLFRKDPGAIRHWSLDHVMHCAGRQKRILADAIQRLKPGGFLIYSTCTHNKYENEDQLEWLIKEHHFSAVDINYPSEWQIYSSGQAYRFFPHVLKGEGLFMSVLQKAVTTEQANKQAVPNQTSSIQKADYISVSKWLESSEQYHFQPFQNNIVHYTGHVHFELFKKQRIYSFGRAMGRIIKAELRPHPHLAYCHNLSVNVPAVELCKADMIGIMNRKIIPSTSENAWTLLTYRGNGLYWAKTIKQYYKVQYPKF